MQEQARKSEDRRTQSQGHAEDAPLLSRVATYLVRVGELDRAKEWYERTLGLQARYLGKEERMVVFDIGGQASLTICEPRETQRPNPGGTSGSYPIFYVEDLDRVHETLRDRGVSVETIESRGGVRWFVFTDPDGNRLEVCHYEKFGL